METNPKSAAKNRPLDRMKSLYIYPMKYTVVDFFAGSGLVSKGFEPNFDTVWANDIDEIKSKIFKANHDCEFILGDICKIKSSEVPDSDVFWGSFPCQDLSLAGKQKGINADRSGLVWEWLRILNGKKNKPKIVVAENVFGLLSNNEGYDYKSLHVGIESAGYYVGCVVLDAIWWVPQSRPRVFVIGIRKDIEIRQFVRKHPSWCHPTPIPSLSHQYKGFYLWDIPLPNVDPLPLKALIDRDSAIDKTFSSSALKLIPKNHYGRMIEDLKLDPEKVFAGYRRTRQGEQKLELRFDDVSGCIRTAKGGSSKQLLVYQKNGKIVARFMLPREAARVMGADDSFKLPVSTGYAYSAMGDAVAVPVTNYLASTLLKKVLDNDSARSNTFKAQRIPTPKWSKNQGEFKRRTYADKVISL